MKTAFVIQSIGPQVSDIRERADRVLDELISPACEQTEYNLIRADQLPEETILEPIISSLFTASIVIADIGSPPWNPNVLVEVGFRMATGRPMQILADVEPDPASLPLHWQNLRIQTIDANNPSSSLDELVSKIKITKKESKSWVSDYPIIEMRVPLTEPVKARYIYANDAAVEVFGVDSIDDIEGQLVSEIDNNFQTFMNQNHWEAYQEDQDSLFGAILSPRTRPIIARVPICFQNHKYTNLNGHTYWPIVVQKKFEPGTQNVLILRVVLIDISKWIPQSVRMQGEGGVVRLPNAFRPPIQKTPPKTEFDLFLSYNSHDYMYVSEFHKGLDRLGLNVWFDENDLLGVHALSTEIPKAMSRSRALALILGSNGLGPWQKNNELRNALLKHCRGERPLLLFLLPCISDSEMWLNYLDEESREEFRDVLENILYVALPPLQELTELLRSLERDGSLGFAARIAKSCVKLLRNNRIEN